MRQRRGARKPKAYYPYAAILGPGEGAGCRIEIGRERGTHYELLRSLGLLDSFESDPGSYVMGRLRFLEGPAVALDTASDFFTGKTGIERPLAALTRARVRAFEACLRERFAGRRIYLMEAGLRMRISGLSEKRIRALLAEGRVIREIV